MLEQACHKEKSPQEKNTDLYIITLVADETGRKYVKIRKYERLSPRWLQKYNFLLWKKGVFQSSFHCYFFNRYKYGAILFMSR